MSQFETIGILAHDPHKPQNYKIKKFAPENLNYRTLNVLDKKIRKQPWLSWFCNLEEQIKQLR